ncbi:DUF1906 domain-containing protein [Streptomyces sp. NBC_00249]|uniref:DUF1906 domain-containing protein n=1 Tax=Streptomyces sp. NBC_00249 TaxID=2975690 RepID=UPI0022526C37|nr:DUF1906 domain-containing protein [Streptomyces sp. NBC_00249]MCX5196720.1 DUF1906 domain-containing protein [Streptomyces sp. NBC_00249]
MPSRTLLRCLLGAVLLLPVASLPPTATAAPAVGPGAAAARATAAAPALAVAVGAARAAAPAVRAAPAGATPAGGSGVDYQGLRLVLPDGWRVVDLDRHPEACLRLDLPTLYLGHAGTQAQCSGRRAVPTRADTLHLEPVEGAPPRADIPTLPVDGTAGLPPAEGDSGEVRYALRDAGVMATLSYGASPDAVRSLLARAAGTRAADAPAGPPVIATAAPAPPRTVQYAFAGQGFDACTAPPQRSMDAWRGTSPFGAVGIYIGGRARACAQPQLTAGWVRRQAEAGWHLMPIWVGPQPWHDAATGLSTDPSKANDQGRAAAEGAVDAARALGLAEGTLLYNDLENYSDRATWDAPVVAYLTAWTVRLHELGYRSAAYVAASSGVKALGAHHHQAPHAMPDVLWVAQWNGAASVTDKDLGLPAGTAMWSGPRRAHQFRGDHDASYGGVTLNIDRSHVDVDPTVLTPVGAPLFPRG